MAADRIFDVLSGRWRSQILYAGVILGAFDHLAPEQVKSPTALAVELGVDAALLYRLLRALASLGFLDENDSHDFSISPSGELLRSDHPLSLKYAVLLREGPHHYAIWRHLPEIIRGGKQDGFVREFGIPAFEYGRKNLEYASLFNQAMANLSALDAELALEALRKYDFSRVHTLCDIGGGYGSLICALLNAHPHLSGIVLDLPEVVGESDQLRAAQLGLDNRCTYVAGDMFIRVPAADAYVLKRILHDWNDQECVRILANARAAAPKGGRVFIIEHIIPGPDAPHFAKLWDIHMMCWGTGRERTEVEYAGLLEAAGWRAVATWYPSDPVVGIIEGHTVF